MLILVTPAYAQQFDLTEMPKGYTLTYLGNDGHLTVTYVGPTGERFMYQYERNSDGIRNVTTVWANRASQLVQFSDGLHGAIFEPHECWPQTGNCNYAITNSEGESAQIRSKIHFEDGILYHQNFVKDDVNWSLQEHGCATIDQYGLPVDLFIENTDGKIIWSTRETTQGLPDPRANFEALKAVCENADELTS